MFALVAKFWTLFYKVEILLEFVLTAVELFEIAAEFVLTPAVLVEMPAELVLILLAFYAIA